MKLFTSQKSGITVLAIAYNRGQAVGLIAKEFEKRKIEFGREDKVEEIDPTAEKKGRAIVFGG